MKTTGFAVFEISGTFIGGRLIEVFLSRTKASQYATECRNKLEGKDRPEYDDYGLCEGTDYIVSACDLNLTEEVRNEKSKTGKKTRSTKKR